MLPTKDRINYINIYLLFETKGYLVGIKKFIKNVKSSLELKDFNKESKKKSLKALLKKLNTRKTSIKKSLESSPKKQEKEAFQEELEILSLQIKKGKKLLHNLYTEK